MVLQASGAISLADIQTEFGGTNPIGMNEYYVGGSYVPSGTAGLPSSGAISLNSFYSKAKSSYTYLITPTNYYTTLTRYTNAYTITQYNTDPQVYLQMNSSSVYSSVTHVYGNNRLQDATSVSIEFDFYITSYSVADALFFYMGYNTTPSSSFTEGNNTPAYQLVIEIYQYAAYTRGFHLIKNGSSTAVASYATTSHLSDSWHSVKIIYNKSATNTFQIYYDGTNIINYSDANYASYVSGSGSYYGIGSRTGGAAGDMYIKALNIGVKGISTYSASHPSGDGSAFCSQWTTFCQNLDSSYSTLRMSSSYDSTGRRCTNSTIVTNIATNLKNRTAYSAYDSATGYTWTTGSCGAESRTLSATGATCQCENPGYVYRPCIGAVSGINWGGIGTAACSAPAQTVTITFS